eukprot:1157535-Pelagomonas_calceolata.AAC.1
MSALPARSPTKCAPPCAVEHSPFVAQWGPAHPLALLPLPAAGQRVEVVDLVLCLLQLRNAQL